MKKRILTISFISLFLLSCSNQNIDGTWILAYDDSKNSMPNFSEVFTFKNGEFERESYSGPTYYEKTNGNFKLENNTVKLNDSTILSIGLITNDSLTLVDEQTTYTLKKLNDTLKSNKSNKININGKKFGVKAVGLKFSNVSYLNGKISYESQPFEESHNYYKRINHNGFDIILQEYAIPKIIKELHNDTIIIYGFHKKIYKIKMWEE